MKAKVPSLPRSPSSLKPPTPAGHGSPPSPRVKMNNVVEGNINFVGQGNPQPAKYYIVPEDYSVRDFAKTFVENKDIPQPQVLISVTGGAQDFKMLSSNLEQIFNRGLLKAAQNTSAWIVTGGLSTGVMEFVGNALRQMDVQVPCIGVATYTKVSHNEALIGGAVNYTAEKKNDAKSASLQQDHTHFILVRNKKDDWGQEIEFRTSLEHYFTMEARVPLVLVALNGGPNTIKTLVEGARQNFPIIIVDQSGRACDAMASFLRHKSEPQRHKLDSWNDLLASVKEPQRNEYTAQMDELYLYRHRITIFNPSENAAEDMDKAILRCIMKFNENTSFYHKMDLGVQWDRVDLIEELLRQEDPSVTSSNKTDAINKALHLALVLNRPEVYEMLISKGADKDSIRLMELYGLADVTYHVNRLRPYAGILANRSMRSSTQVLASESTRLLAYSTGDTSLAYLSESTATWDIARKVFHSINPIYAKLLDDNRVTFTDALVWAIVVDRPALARAIWRNMEYPIHAALMACHLYSILVEWFQGEESYQLNRDWFEAEAISVLAEADYDNALPILKWKWEELNDYNALQIAELADCKDFTSHPFVQRYLNQKLYCDSQGSIPPGTPMWRVVLLVLLPFLIPISGTYIYEDRNRSNSNNPNSSSNSNISSFSNLNNSTFNLEPPPTTKTRFYHFYNLPVVKIVTSTACYEFDIEWYEYCLWIWVFASLVEEFVQYTEDRENYFDALSNQMDLFMNLGLLACILLIFPTFVYRTQGLAEAYSDVLLISNIACFVRLMNVFAVSKSLGPLFFVIIRLFNDVLQWFFIFIVFMLSFQLGIFALTRQARKDPWTFYPVGTMGVGFSTIIGEQGDNTMDYMRETEIGVFLISLYALISQVMLVNLLIAMMGDTYSTVKANSDKEWKFYRYGLIIEFISTSPYPPPFNLIFGPPFYLKHHFFPRRVSSEVQQQSTVIHMKIAKDKLENSNKQQKEIMNLMKEMASTIQTQQLTLVSHERALELLHGKFDSLSVSLSLSSSVSPISPPSVSSVSSANVASSSSSSRPPPDSSSSS